MIFLSLQFATMNKFQFILSSSRSQSRRHHARQLHGQGPPLVRPQLEQVQRRVVGQDFIRRRSDGGHAGEQLQEQVNRLAEVFLVSGGQPITWEGL